MLSIIAEQSKLSSNHFGKSRAEVSINLRVRNTSLSHAGGHPWEDI